MKKKLILAMALIMTVMIAGCGDGKPDGASQDSGMQGTEISGSLGAAGGEGALDPAQASEGGKQTGDNDESGQQEASEPDGAASAGSAADMGYDESWKAVYADFLENDMDALLGEYESDWRDSWSFGFIYLNNDSVPELVLSSGYEAAGNMICTPVGDRVAYLQTARLNFFYTEYGNVLDNAEGSMGYYYDYIYKIGEQGFERIHEGNHYAEYDNEGNIARSLFDMDGSEVTEEAYNKLIDDLLPMQQRLFWGSGCTYGDLMDYLKGDAITDYREAYRNVIRDGVEGFSGSLDRFALIERENLDPLLLCAGDREYCFYAFDDGLLQKGPTTFFSETEFILVYPGIGIIENNQYYENNEMNCSRYFMRGGSLLYVYAASEAARDTDWEPILDADGMPVITYRINSSEASEKQFNEWNDKYMDHYKVQLASPAEDYTFIEYSSAIQMYDKLSE